MIKNYNSFKEIDERLKILKLQKEIQIEDLKYNLNSVKTRLSPASFFEDFGVALKQTVMVYVIRLLKHLFHNHQPPEH